MLRVAILGANGFIGSRTVEFFHLGGLADVRPVARSRARLARAARFDLDCRVADAFDCRALTNAFAGCDAVVHAVAGDPHTVRGSVEPAYRAAQAAGVRRFLYLSSASVHGQAPEQGTDENSPLKRRQPLPYNRAKIDAEKILRKLRAGGDVELVMLRPGIVFGPRSAWVANFIDSLLAGAAYMVDDGRGICNTIYVDNLARAIHLALLTPGVDGEAFVIGDRETVTWADFYRTFAEAVGRDLGEVHRISPFAPGLQEKIGALAVARPVRALAGLLPRRVRRGLSLALSFHGRSPAAPNVWQGSERRAPRATLELSLLHQCAYKLPWAKAKSMLGYEPTVSFAEGCRRTIAWLEFAGYPVPGRDAPHSSLLRISSA
jgi:nucleoside-diphosphate-sugar epimerase